MLMKLSPGIFRATTNTSLERRCEQTVETKFQVRLLGGNPQNFLPKFVRFFLTLGLKIWTLFRLKVLFEADIIKG